MMNYFIRFIDKTNEWVGKAVSFLLIPLVLITAYEVVMRYIVERPTIWSWDLNIQIFAAIIMLGGGYTLLNKNHVVVDVLVMNMGARKRAILDLITSFFFFMGMLVLLAGGWEMAWLSFNARETMPTIWAPPYYPMKMLIPAGTLLVVLQGISELLKNIIIVFSLKGVE
ncbi:MAG: TRAP transporter small permease subunit [bacterium]|nr:TRAP transporter small permease subunit [bacterium]